MVATLFMPQCVFLSLNTILFSCQMNSRCELYSDVLDISHDKLPVVFWSLSPSPREEWLMGASVPMCVINNITADLGSETPTAETDCLICINGFEQK